MAGTLFTGSQADLLRANPSLAFQLGPYRYSIAREGEASFYSVTDGRQTFKAPIRWAVGQGGAGQTYLFEHDRQLYESRVSYYNSAQGLAVTVGAPPGDPKDLLEAAGRRMTAQDVFACLSCHSAPNPSPEIDRVARGSLAWADARVPGVQCENCHTGSVRHAAGFQRGSSPVAQASLKGMGAEDMNDLCGVCHRTWADIKLNGPRGVANVKFQPYRLVLSKCYDASDSRISCVACHDPHDRAEAPSASSYDKACLACHSAPAAKKCKTGAGNCVSCHMPKFEMPGAHHQFSDHFIRIARPGAPYPD
jgi:hypothetical protein